MDSLESGSESIITTMVVQTDEIDKYGLRVDEYDYIQEHQRLKRHSVVLHTVKYHFDIKMGAVISVIIISALCYLS